MIPSIRTLFLRIFLIAAYCLYYWMVKPRLPMKEKNTKQIRRVCVIGAGFSGIAAARSLMKNGGDYSIVIYEGREDLGGIWYQENVKPKLTLKEQTDLTRYLSPCWDTMVTNSGTRSTFLSDQPLDLEGKLPIDGVSHKTIKEYIEAYAKNNNIYNKIQFNTTVSNVDKMNNKWLVHIQTLDRASVEEFDAVIVCTGTLWSPLIPKIPGIENFEGDVVHTSLYTNAEPFKNKSVLVVGSGTSSTDIALETSFVAKNVYYSTRNGRIYIPKRFFGDKVTGTDFLCLWFRFRGLFWRKLHHWTGLFKDFTYPKRDMLDLTPYGVPPPDLSASIENDHLLSVCKIEFMHRLKEKAITAKGRIKRVLKRSVEFEDGSSIEVDSIILCTGFKTSYPFLTKFINTEKYGTPYPLYEQTFYSKDPTLCFVGAPRSSLHATVAEMQSRWVAAYLNGLVGLPTEQDMLNWQTERIKKYGKSENGRAINNINIIDFCEFVANQTNQNFSFVRDFNMIEKLFYRPYSVQRFNINDQKGKQLYLRILDTFTFHIWK